jgi:hypothetical protein
MRMLLLILLLVVSNAVSADPLGDNAKYRINSDGDLLVDADKCMRVRKHILETATSQWQSADFSWSNDQACHPIKWVVKPNRGKSERPTFYYRNRQFIPTGERVEVGAPCQPPMIKLCKRCDTRMLVSLSPKTYASCVSSD